MADPALRRTIRRCVAVLSIPLSLSAMIPIAALDDDGHTYNHVVLEVADQIAALVLIGAVLYLVGSVALQVSTALSAEGEPTSNA